MLHPSRSCTALKASSRSNVSICAVDRKRSVCRTRLTHKVSYRVRCKCSSCNYGSRCRPSLLILLCQTGAWIWR